MKKNKHSNKYTIVPKTTLIEHNYKFKMENKFIKVPISSLVKVLHWGH